MDLVDLRVGYVVDLVMSRVDLGLSRMSRRDVVALCRVVVVWDLWI